MSQWLMSVSDPGATPSSWRSSSLKSSWWSFASLQNTGDIAAGGGSGLAGQHKLRHSFRYNTSNSQIHNGHYNLGYGYHNPAFSTSINHLSGTALSVTKYNQKNIKRSVISSQRKLVKMNIYHLSCDCAMSSHVLMSYKFQVGLIGLSFCDGLAAEYARPLQHQQQQQHGVHPPAQAGAVKERVQSRRSSQNPVTIRSAEFRTGPWRPDLHPARLRPRGPASQHLPGKF